LRSSAISSATGNDRPSATAAPRSFALTGRSRPLDPRTNAVRPDIADVRLAEYVFAPHYAAAVERRIAAETVLRAARPVDSEALATLGAGEPFELLDVTGGDAWGIATAHGLVGYLDAALLENPA